MTRKHFIAIAAIIDARRDELTTEGILLLPLARDMADMFAADNPRFDRERFLKACGF